MMVTYPLSTLSFQLLWPWRLTLGFKSLGRGRLRPRGSGCKTGGAPIWPIIDGTESNCVDVANLAVLDPELVAVGNIAHGAKGAENLGRSHDLVHDGAAHAVGFSSVDFRSRNVSSGCNLA